VEDRLTEQGGTAEASVSAIPAVRLLFGSGNRLEAKGEDLELDLSGKKEKIFERLDGFGEVDVTLESSKAGPLEIKTFKLVRESGMEEYRLEMEATSSPRELARFVAEELAGPAGSLLGSVAGAALPQSDAPVPVTLDARLESRDGRPKVTSGGGEVSGVPLGPIAEALVAAVAGRL